MWRYEMCGVGVSGAVRVRREGEVEGAACGVQYYAVMTMVMIMTIGIMHIANEIANAMWIIEVAGCTFPNL